MIPKQLPVYKKHLNLSGKSHGREYQAVFDALNGYSGTFIFVFNGFKFKTPWMQGTYEIQNRCLKHGSSFKSFVITERKRARK